MNIIRQTWRDGVVAMALECANMTWRAEEKNVFHGYDVDGVLVNTPDIDYKSPVFDCGWWQVGRLNSGMAYSWGGASTFEDFAKGIAGGKYAGNVPDSRENRGSRHCVGVDCSGLVTVCWGLEKKLSTKTIPLAAVPLSSLDLLLPGDAILTSGHVLIFTEFLDNSKTEANIVDSSRRTGRVLLRTVPISELLAEGYMGYRKKG